MRAELHFFSGINFGGRRSTVSIFHDGRRQGDEVDGSRLKSYGIIAGHGTRLTLASDRDGSDDLVWRSIVVLPEHSFTSQSGRPAVQVPDIDAMDPPEAIRTAWDTRCGFPQVPSRDEGIGWTYGRSSLDLPLACNVRWIRLDRVALD